MATVGEIHGENFISQLQHAEIHSHVGLTSAVGLDISVIGSEEFLGAFDGECFDDIDIFAAAIPAASWVSFCIFVCQAGTLCLHHGLAGEIFGGDQLNMFNLAVMLCGNGCRDLRIGFSELTACIVNGVAGDGGHGIGWKTDF